MTKEERASLKCLFPRDKRGQGLGYRLTETQTKDGRSQEAASRSADAPSLDASLSEQRNSCDGSLLTNRSECHNELDKDRVKDKCNEDPNEKCTLSQEEKIQDDRRGDISGSDVVQNVA